MNGKTEYYKDDNFIKLYDDKVKKYLTNSVWHFTNSDILI
jgi:hypothetical protein